MKQLKPARVRQLLANFRKQTILVVGDVMLDQFIWGNVSRISPEAPAPVVDFSSESFMPGGAANVARNLSALDVSTEIYRLAGKDQAAAEIKTLLAQQTIACGGLISQCSRPTRRKPRI